MHVHTHTHTQTHARTHTHTHTHTHYKQMHYWWWVHRLGRKKTDWRHWYTTALHDETEALTVVLSRLSNVVFKTSIRNRVITCCLFVCLFVVVAFSLTFIHSVQILTGHVLFLCFVSPLTLISLPDTEIIYSAERGSNQGPQLCFFLPDTKINYSSAERGSNQGP